MRVNQADFKQLNPPNDPISRIRDYAEYAQCCKDLNKLGRLHVDEVIKRYGYARVVQVLAATIIDYHHEYESPEIRLAHQIPMPIRSRVHHVDINPAFVRKEFYRLIEMHLL